MPDITVVQFDGAQQGFEAPAGVSLMQAVTGFGVPGLLAECGGAATCATCHVQVHPDWALRLPPPSPAEADTLAFTATERTAASRLACCIVLTDELQGLVVHLPEYQQ